MQLRNGPLLEGREIQKCKFWIVFAFLAIISLPLIAQTASPEAKRETGQAAPTRSPKEYTEKKQ
jgi:hypothetical protein